MTENTKTTTEKQHSDSAKNQANGKHGLPPLIVLVGRACAVAGMAVTVFGGIAGLLILAQSRIENAVERKLSDPAILRKIASESRPMLIFDSQGSFLADMGAVQFIKDHRITIVRTNVFAGADLPLTIDIDFTSMFSIAPLITPLQTDMVVISPERGPGCSWHFDVHYSGGMGLPPEQRRTYRLELMR